MQQRHAGSDLYECDGCGYRSTRWLGFCPRCRDDAGLRRLDSAAGAVAAPVRLSEASGGGDRRRSVSISEVDRVLGGGLVAGASVLLGGEPGVGKSTLLLQVAGSVAGAGGSVLVVSAEESAAQVALRAGRIGVDTGSVWVLSEAELTAVAGAVERADPDLLIVDSIQTVFSASAEGTPGGVSQVRECASLLVSLARSRNMPVVMVGHVTKDGGLAGPKLLEHMVDVVLHLEGDPDRGLRFLRGLKNRFGPVNEIGIFEMRETGLVEVADPSMLLVADRLGEVPGTVLYPALEGRRPLMVEVQALVAPGGPQPRRSVKGLEPARVQQLLAVLERHAELPFSSHDVFVGVAGGVRIREPGVDLPLALALASSLLGIPIGAVAAWGEVGLTGEIRAVDSEERRTKESRRLGVGRMIHPAADRRSIVDALLDAGLVPLRRVAGGGAAYAAG